MVLQNHHPICQHCGTLAVPPAPLCPSCGAPLVPVWPSQNAGPSSAFPFPPAAGIPSQSNYVPLLVELLLNLIGICGVGWMLAGYKRGFIMLLGSILWWPVLALLSLLTLGLFFLCLGPVALVAIACNSLWLWLAIKRKAC